jgi:Transposase DDE domain group 1
MQTQCNSQQFEFEAVERRAVVAAFDGGAVSSDAGVLLLSKLDRGIGLIGRFAGCFDDGRDPDLVEHSVKTLVGQRVLGIALGYEDLIDHDQLRHDPLWAAALGKLEPKRRDECAPLAGKSTLNRLERSPHNGRYHKVAHRAEAIEALFVELFLDAHATVPERIVLDLDATDDPVHGEQEGRFFHGYYGHYCYLPLYIFCGKHLLVAKLRPSNIDGSAGSVEELERVIGRIRARWPKVQIVLRADSGFARDALMAWCEASGVDYVFGLAKNSRLEARIKAELAEAKRLCEASAKPARLFKDFVYQTLDSWSAARRVIGKAEHLPAGANPRFIVTSLGCEEWQARALYEDLYCARGEMENRIKEQQLDLFADRTSTATMRANQLRLWFASMAYVLLARLRDVALAGTELANATAGTIRLKLLKIGALVKLSVRRVRIAMASGCPYQDVFAHAYGAIARLGASP